MYADWRHCIIGIITTFAPTTFSASVKTRIYYKGCEGKYLFSKRNFARASDLGLMLSRGAEPDSRSSYEGSESAGLHSPMNPWRPLHIGSDLSPPPSRGQSTTRVNRRSKLNPFHSHRHSGDYSGDSVKDSDVERLE